MILAGKKSLGSFQVAEYCVLVPGKKYPETGVILESEFCMVQNPCLSKSHTKFGLQDHPCFRILLAWDKYHTATTAITLDLIRACLDATALYK